MSIGRCCRAVAVALAMAAAVAGCAPKARQAGPVVFFPPAPDLPRIQYLTRLGGLRDIETQSSFNRFVVGEKPDVKLDKPYGVAAFRGKIYVCDTNGTVMVFDLVAKTFGALAGAAGQGALRGPVNIHITADGTKYVSDPLRGQVVVFGADDQYVRAYGASASWKPVDAVPFAGELFVADMQSRRIAVLDLETGEQKRTVGDSGPPGDRLDRPTNLAFDGEGRLYVTDVSRFQIVRFDREGKLEKTFGRLGDSPGHFARPKGIALDRQGFLYAVDAAFSNVQVFTPGARIAMFFGGPGETPGALVLPAGVAIDYDNIELFREYIDPGFAVDYLVMVVGQFGEPAVSVYAFGKQQGKKYPADEELLRLIEDQKARGVAGAR